MNQPTVSLSLSLSDAISTARAAISAAQEIDRQIEEREELSLPGGQLSTLRLVRLPLGMFEPALEIWLAPALDYAPVRMRLTQPAGDSLDYQWSGTDRR
jgi:hypothetical protein